MVEGKRELVRLGGIQRKERREKVERSKKKLYGKGGWRDLSKKR